MLKDCVWVEKYRPQKIDDIILEQKEIILKFFENPKSIPHFLLSSRSPGTGKTTLALAIIKELGCDKLILNSSDERKIEVVREKIKLFVSGQSSKIGIKRCIIMDEMDGVLKPSQNALRNIMETYSRNCFFIITANHVEKIIEPIRSRCIKFNLSNPPKKNIFKYLVNICDKENIKFTQKGIQKIINKYYPDIRSTVQILQKAKVKNQNIDEEFTCISEYEKNFKELLDGNFIDIKKKIIKGELNSKDFNCYIFDNIFKKKGLGFKKIKKIVYVLAENELGFSYGGDEIIIFIAGLLKIRDIIRRG